MATTYSSTLISLTGLTVGRSLLSAVCQAMLVEVGQERSHSGVTVLVGDNFLYSAGGSLLAALVSTKAVSHFGPRKALRLALLLPACLFLKLAHYEYCNGAEVTDSLAEVSEAAPRNLFKGFADLQVMLRQPIIWGPLVFLFLYNSGPNYDDSLYVYFVNVMHFEPYMVGQLVVMHSLAKLIGVFLYRYVLRGVQDRKLIVTLTAVSCPLLLSPLLLTTGLYHVMHIDPRLLALSGELIREVFVHLQMMPAMARWVQLAPKQSEGTVVSLLISTMNFSRAFSKGSSAAAAYFLGVTATNFDNISLLILISGSSALVPIAFASDLIPDDQEHTSSSEPRIAPAG
jgi:Na+/melibiose symporter-like transporter